jgi:Ca-activated chloride channel family protein
VESRERLQLDCIAKAGGGRYFPAKNTMQLKQALTEVKKEVIKKVTVTSKPEPKPKAPVEPGLKLRALLKEGTEPVTKGVNWEVYKAEKDTSGDRERVASSNKAESIFHLSPGRYFIEAKYGNINAISSMEVEVIPGELTETNMNLKAGYLRLRAVLKEGGKPVPKDMHWQLYEAEKDINGHRELILSEKGPAPLNKLSAGRYFIVAKHGKATSSMEVEVTAGELKKSTINLNAGYLKLNAVSKESRKQVFDMRWKVYKSEKDINGKREKIDSSTAPEPLFKLSAGRYFIHAKHGKAGSSMEVEVAAGKRNETTLNLSKAE